MARRILIIYFLFAFLSSLSACRLWAVCSKEDFVLSSLSYDDRALILEELEAFFQQSKTMSNGWALLNYDSIADFSNSSLYRSSITAVNDSSAYWNNALALVDSGANRIGIGHLRLASSGANNIPNPHPWIFDLDGIAYSLIHNGTISKTKLYDLITNYGSDLSWLNMYKPNTFSDNLWSTDEGWSNVVDSELLLLYIMQQINNRGNLIDGLKKALTELLNVGINAGQINIVFSNGSDLYVFGGQSGLSIMESSKHISVMTQPVNYSHNSNLNWSGIWDKEMVHINKWGIFRYPDFIQQSNYDNLNPIVSFNLKPAFPNPFNGETTIPFEIESVGSASLSIFSILGEKVFSTVLNQNQLQQGYIKWNPLNNSQKKLSSGTYIIRAETEIISVSRKILFIK